MSSLLRLERQQKYFLNPLQIRFLSSFICWNWNDRYVNKLPYFPGKPNPIPDQNGQSLYPFQTETAQNYTLWGGTHLGGLYKEVTPPPHPGMKLPRPMNDGYFDAIHLMSHLIIVWYVPKQQNTFREAFIASGIILDHFLTLLLNFVPIKKKIQPWKVRKAHYRLVIPSDI